jgi:ribosomal-protein-alanine N-acetyltransferase
MGNQNSLKEVPRLESERLILREFTELDAQNIFEYASDPEVNFFMPWDKHETINDTKKYLDKSKIAFQNSDSIDWGIELKSENKLIGAISIRNWNDINSCADAGYIIARKYWGRGITTEALKTVIKFSFENLHANRVEAHCDENNSASFRVMEKAGMKYEGTHREKFFIKGKFISVRFYSILKSEYFGI